jgi:predicted dehydrogenase
MNQNTSRRDFLKTATAAAAAGTVPYFFTGDKVVADEQKAEAKSDRPILGCIGTGSRWNAVGPNAMRLADCVAVCDVDGQHAARARERVKSIQGRDVEVHEDYRKILDRKDVDVVTVVTPDHWHTKIAIEAMQAGKDVYCEKPLTLTIEEGKQLCKVKKETGRTFQVGTQQRSEMGLKFLQAIAMIRDGRIGEVKEVQCAIGAPPTSPKIPAVTPPEHLNWNLWLGQTPLTAYRYMLENGKRPKTRCHYEFRWWYEYSGGKMTDWGAHHVDIAQWGIGMDQSGPTSVNPVMVEHPVPFEDGMPTVDDQYNTAVKFLVECMFPNGVKMTIRHDTDNGILFTGTKGRLFVNRGKLTGQAVDELKENPLPEDAIAKVYKGKEPAKGNAHMANFFECIKTREEPISDVFTHHRALTTCHLANIAMRLDRALKWDPETEQIVGDDDANAWQRREQRKGFEINVQV